MALYVQHISRLSRMFCAVEYRALGRDSEACTCMQNSSTYRATGFFLQQAAHCAPWNIIPKGLGWVGRNSLERGANGQQKLCVRART